MGCGIRMMPDMTGFVSYSTERNVEKEKRIWNER